MFYLPNKIGIDTDGVVDGMLDEEVAVTHYLDLKTGDVVSEDEHSKKTPDSARYFKIEKIADRVRQKWIKEFIRDIVNDENKKLGATLKTVLEEKGTVAFCELLEETNESLLDAWYMWEDECAFERLEYWFEKLPVDVTEEFNENVDGDCNCIVCQGMQAGGLEDELLDRLLDELNESADMDESFHELKNASMVETALEALIKKYSLEKELSVATVKKWIYNSGKDELEASTKFFMQWSTVLENAVRKNPENVDVILGIFNDAWNYFPHKSLDGKSPNDMWEEKNSIMQKITVTTTISAPIEEVWACWTETKHITHWTFASGDWCSPRAENDLKVGGRFMTRMEAKDGSAAFDFNGVYAEVVENEKISYTLEGGREVDIAFTQEGNVTTVTETFDPETENPLEMQRAGWQAILDNFKRYVELNS